MSSSSDSDSDSSSNAGSSSSGGSSTGTNSSGGEEAFPPEFPLDGAIYDQAPFANFTKARLPRGYRTDPRRRKQSSLYPLDWLTAPPPPGRTYAPAPVAHLRTKWQQAFAQAGNGEWKFVEYVPAWSDPDWSARFTYTRDPDDSDDDAVARQYAKPGLLQTQRPALRADDAGLRPTDAAKRWGVYPWNKGPVQGVPRVGVSGTTPRYGTLGQFAGLSVALDTPLFSVAQGGDADFLTIEDVKLERENFEAARFAAGMETSDEDFRAELLAQASNPVLGTARNTLAGALLSIFETWYRNEETAAYQRLLFAGNTSDEVSCSLISHIRRKIPGLELT